MKLEIFAGRCASWLLLLTKN